MTRRLKDLAADEKRQHGFGDFGVDDVENTFYTLPGGERLALRLYSPAGAISDGVNILPGVSGAGGRFPAILEYLPYRKADWTAERDHRRHPWMASHGYVVVRADIRGAGDSDGVYHDEYLKQEMDDCCHLIGNEDSLRKFIYFNLVQIGSPPSPGAMARSGCTARAGAASMASRWPSTSPPPWPR